MEAKYFTTPDGLQLLRDWSNGCFDEMEYTRNERRAKRAAARLFLSGNLIFECGEKPRTSAEFFDAMPYTSTSDFAAVWACNWSIRNRKDKYLHFDGIALTDGTAVAVWTRYNENGDEIATEYEKI